MSVRCLTGQVHSHLAGRLVVVRHAATGLHRSRVDARVERVERDHDIGVCKRTICGVGIAGLPREDVIIRLAFEVRAHDRCISIHRMLGIDDHGQRVVVDVDTLKRVLCLWLGLGDDRHDLLALEANLVRGEHGLGVTREGRHPGEAMSLEVLAGDAGEHAWHCHRTRRVDRIDRGVCERRAIDRHKQHPGELHVVDVGALAADEAVVLDALGRLPNRAFNMAHGWCAHAVTPCCFLAAYCTALTMLT